MKRIICLITTLCLVFGSFSFAFANDWSSTDQQNLSSAASRLYYSGYSAAYYLYQISSKLTTLSNITTDIKNALFHGGQSIGYWIHDIEAWMSPIYNAITAIPIDNQTIIGALGYYTDNGSTYHPFLNDINNILTKTTYTLFPLTVGQDNNITFGPTSTTTNAVTAIINRLYYLEWGMAHWNNTQNVHFANLKDGYNSTQTFVNHTDLSTSTFTPSSTTNGIYTWLSKIQNPVARLSYVLASDERIEAQEAAAANEEAVVDNFIDSSGSGSASPSDIGSISDLSSGYKSNFGSDASVSGIFNIFNSNNMGWFSQETANQLDTTTNTRRGYLFDTPLLDQQIVDIYDQIGVKHD